DGITVVNEAVEEYTRLGRGAVGRDLQWYRERGEQFLPEFEDYVRKLSKSPNGRQTLRAAYIVNGHFTESGPLNSVGMGLGIGNVLQQYVERELVALGPNRLSVAYRLMGE